MKGNKRRLLLLTVTCMIAMLMLSGGSASAASEPKCAPNITMRFSEASQITGGNIYIGGTTSDAQITSVKSSNKKVEGTPMEFNVVSVFVKAKSELPYKAYTLKNGEKAKFTIKVKQRGKTYTLKTTVKFVKQTNPVKSVKLDGKSYSKFSKNKYGVTTINANQKLPSKIKVNVTLKKGYKIAWLEGSYFASGWVRSVQKKFKNGAAVDTKCNGGSLAGIDVYYYEPSDLQGIATEAKLIKTRGGSDESIQILFKK